jgi:CRP/FNR family transcriptional regulator
MITFAHAFEQFANRILPASLTDAAHLQFQSLARLSQLAKDASFEFEDSGQQIVFVASGATKLVAHASESRDQIVAFHFAGDVFTVPEPDNYSYSVCAIRDCDILTFPAAEFLTLATGEPGILHHLLENTTVSLRRCREKTIALGRKTASERIAVFLLSMADRIGVPQDGRITLDLPMSRRDIAESLGLTIETVSRELTKLRERGAIETCGRSTIVLLERPSLQRSAGFLQEAA